jgi:hypothetical protein
MNVYESGVLISKAAHKNELMLFIEFHSFLQSLFLYLKAFLAYSLFAFIICSAHGFKAKPTLKVSLNSVSAN